MRVLVSVCALVCVTAGLQAAGDWTLPQSLKLKQGSPQTYRFTCDYHYQDTKGRVGRQERISALYTRDLPQGRVRWSGVAVSESAGAHERFGPPQARAFMEGFGYSRADATKMLDPAFFPGFPAAAVKERNLVWDTHMLEGFGQDHFSDLKLNVPYSVPNTAEVSLAGAGTFKHKDLQLVWTGNSRRNGQECAVIDYRAFFNALDMKMPGMNLVAGSHYWGQIWVSLATKRIEHATIYENLLGELTLQGPDKPQIISVFRSGVFEPVLK